MQRVIFTQYGGPEVMRLGEIGDLEPGPGEVLVEVAAGGVNFIDLNQRSGDHRVRLPWRPGIRRRRRPLRALRGHEAIGEGPGAGIDL